MPGADKEPAKATSTCFDDIPGIEDRNESASWAMRVRLGCLQDRFSANLRKRLVASSKVIRFPRESEKVQDSEDGHFDTCQH